MNFDIPIGTGASGGRKDLDVLAVDVISKEIHVVDITNIWSGSVDEIVRGVVDRLSEAVRVISDGMAKDIATLRRRYLSASLRARRCRG